MQFKDEYTKMNRKNKLSEEFIQSLASKMTDVYEENHKEITEENTEEMTQQIKEREQESENECNKNKDSEQEIESTVIKHDNNKELVRRRITATAAVAAAVVFAAGIMILGNSKENIITDPGKRPDITITGCSSQVSKTSQKVTQKAEETQQSADQTQITTVTSQQQSQAETQKPVDNQQYSLPFSSVEQLKSFALGRLALNSPLNVGYEAAGYTDMLGELYNVNCTENGYSYGIKDVNGLSGTGYQSYDESGTVESVLSSAITQDDLEQFNRILKHADDTVGKDNYYIYDINRYQFQNKYEYGFSKNSNATQENKFDYCVQIVPKEYYERYKAAGAGNNNFVITLEVVNDQENSYTGVVTDSVLRSQYECFVINQKAADNFYNDFNSQFDDCALSIGNVIEDEWGLDINSPFIPWFKNTADGDPMYRKSLQFITKCCIMPEDDPSTLGVTPFIDASLYFRPGTSQDEITSRLQQMKDLFKKYRVMSVTVDILKNESDYERYKNSGGYIQDQTIDSSYRRYCNTYSDEFPSWNDN